MNFHSLYYFKKAAELQHLTKASQELYVAQPSLSRTISSLEEELGVKLFDRVGKNIILNDYGRIVLKHAEVIFREEDSIYAEIADRRNEGSSTVRLSMRAGTQHLAELLYQFSKTYPDIRVSTLQGYVSKDEFEKLDFSIFARTHPKCDEKEHLLYEENILIALPADHRMANNERVDFRDLKNERFISLPKGSALRMILDEYCSMAGFEPNIQLECDSAETVRKTLRLGGALSLVPELSWGGISTENTVLRPLSFPEGKRWLYLSENNKSYLTDAAQKFRDFTIAYFQDIVENGAEAYISGYFVKAKGN